MRVYFLAEKPCALFVNGAHLGLVDLFERSAELRTEDGLFLELVPSGEFLPVRFRFDEEFLLQPPPHVSLYYLSDGVAVYADGFLRADQSLRVLWQQRFGNALLTLCLQGKLQLSVETELGFHLLDLPDCLEKSAVRELNGLFLIESESAFALVDRNGKAVVLSEGKAAVRGDALEADVPFHDSLGHAAHCVWENGTLVSCTVRAAREPTEATYALALFESALVGADCAPYLSPALREKAPVLREYLGDFRSVVMTAERDRVGLVFPRAERVYDVRYFRVSVSDGKISNILPE